MLYQFNHFPIKQLFPPLIIYVFGRIMSAIFSVVAIPGRVMEKSLWRLTTQRPIAEIMKELPGEINRENPCDGTFTLAIFCFAISTSTLSPLIISHHKQNP